MRICVLGLLLSVRFAGGPMKKALLSLLLIAGWLACFPAYATTYTYNVDYSFTTTPGQVTGLITTSCDFLRSHGEQCPLVVIHRERWHERQFVRPDRRDNVPGLMLQATPTGISTVANQTTGGFFAFCSDISNNGSDCFNTAGLNVDNIFHSPPQPFPISHISWEENSSAQGIFATVLTPEDGVFSFFHRDCLAGRRAGTAGLGHDDRWLCRLRLRRPSRPAAYERNCAPPDTPQARG